MTTYWKAARPDGTDFHSGLVQLVPPAGHVGEWVVSHPTSSQIGRHASTHLSVATAPTDCAGMKWPCRLLEVAAVGEVTTPNRAFPHKRAGVAFRVLREVPASEALGPQGEHVAALISSIPDITRTPTKRVALARDAAWAAARDAARAATLALLVRDLITTEQYDALTRPWRTAIGPIHPDDPAL